MPTTEGQGPRRRHAAVGVLVALVVALAANWLADATVGLYATLSAVAWEDFRAADRLDCAFVGSSYAQLGFDPTVYDEVLGTESLNLATPGQLISDTRDTAEAAIDEKGASRIIVGIGIQSFTLAVDPYAEVPYIRARYRHDPLSQAAGLVRLAMDPAVIGTKSSLNCILFPWTFTSVQSPQDIIDNIQSRLSGEALSSAAEKVVLDWQYVGKGYGNYDHVRDPNRHDTTVSVYGMPKVREDCLEQLSDLCAFCRERGVDLVVVATPHPAFDLLAMGPTYPEIMGRVQGMAEGYGATYLDLSLTREGVLELSPEDFIDYEHLNLSGARIASRVLAQLLARRDAREDVSRDFYSYDEWDAWVEAHE